MISALTSRLTQIQDRIAAAAARAARDPARIRLIAVSKKQPLVHIEAAYALGQRAFGENYAQEMREKALAFSPPDLEWHFMGTLQRNKVKAVVPHAAWIHSLDSLRVAETIQRLAPHPIACLVEVNVAGEATKGGVAPAAITPLLAALRAMPQVNVCGLMCMPPPAADAEQNRPYFRALRELRDQHKLTELSMGMSDDFEVAIEEGATMVRIGSAIFGARELC